eukprot:534235_1
MSVKLSWKQEIRFSSKSYRFELNWKHISNAIKHLLYEKIESSFIDIINSNNTQYQEITNILTVDSILTVLQTQNKISQNEVNYIRKIATKALDFAHEINVEINDNYENNVQMIADDIVDNTIPKLCGLNSDIVSDIYNIHNCFLFANYQFCQYGKSTFWANVITNNYFNPNRIETPSATKILKWLLNHDKWIPEIELFPQFIIDDDIYDIWRYFFAASRLVNKLMEKTNQNIDHHKFKLKVCVIPNRVTCMYDENIVFPYGITNINDYLKSKNIILVPKKQPIELSESDVSTINNIYEVQLSKAAQRSQNRNVLIIVDRRETDKTNVSKMYMIASNHDLKDLHELNQNYFISLEFNVYKNVVRCHLFYGTSNLQRMRFYPE